MMWKFNYRKGLLGIAVGALLLGNQCTSEGDEIPGAGTTEDLARLTLSVTPAQLSVVGTSQTATVKAKVQKGSGSKAVDLRNQTVYFDLPNGGGELSGTQAVTGADGSTTVTFSPGSQKGNFLITGTLLEPESKEIPNNFNTRQVYISLVDTMPACDILTGSLSPETITVNQTASVQVNVVDCDGNAVADGTQVQFEIVTTGFEDSSITASRLTEGGTAKAVFTAGTRTGTVELRACVGDCASSSIIYPDTGEGAFAVTIAPREAGQINCGTIDPTVIGVKGSGLPEVAEVQFLLFYADGTPAENIEVQFTLNGPGGGEFTDPLVAESATGTVVTRVHSGTTPGPVSVNARVTSATIGGSIIQTNCSGLSIAGGVPNAHHISLVADKDILEGLICLEYPGGAGAAQITAAYADVFGMRVPEGRNVSFFSEAGAVPREIRGDTEGFATGSLNPERPGPIDTDVPRSSIPEAFLDVNGNGIYDNGEPFDDEDLSGEWSATPCLDYCTRVPAEAKANCGDATNPECPIGYNQYDNNDWYMNSTDGVVNYLVAMRGQEGFYDSNANGLYESTEEWDDLGEPFIDANGDGIYNGIRHDPKVGDETYTDLNANCQYDEGEPFDDANGNGSYNTPNCLDEFGNNYPGCNPEEYNEPYFDANNSGHYEVGADPFLDLNGNGMRDVAEFFVDSKTTAGNLACVYDLSNGRWDSDTQIYPFGPTLIPGSNISNCGPGSNLLFIGHPTHVGMQFRREVCVVNGEVGQEGLGEVDCSTAPTDISASGATQHLTYWSDNDNPFYVPVGRLGLFRALTMDFNFNPFLRPTDIPAISVTGEGTLDAPSGKLGGARFVYFTLSGKTPKPGDVCGPAPSSLKLEGKMDTACIDYAWTNGLWGYVDKCEAPPTAP